jgi:hypothetical protein
MWTAILLQVSAAVAAAPLATIDHVILATSDLERGMAEVERLTGVRPQQGGAHPGRGTRNALMSLGAGVYLELIAPDPAQPADLRAAKRLGAVAGLIPDGWAIAPTDISALRASYAAAGIPLTPPLVGGRVRPDGQRLAWRTFGVQGDDRSTVPFFINWSDMRLHPSQSAPGGCTLGGVVLRDPAPDTLRTLLRPAGLTVQIERADAGAMEIRLRCPAGEVVFR